MKKTNFNLTLYTQNYGEKVGCFGRTPSIWVYRLSIVSLPSYTPLSCDHNLRFHDTMHSYSPYTVQ